jgi:hypothetical protein
MGTRTQVNNFIERAPTSAKAIIEHCDVLRERDVAKGLLKVGSSSLLRPAAAAAQTPTPHS